MHKIIVIVVFLLPVALLFTGEPKFGERMDRGLVEHPALDEASGIAASRKNPDVLWAHNDSGDRNRLFALSSTGKHLGEFTIQGASARDWEDMAVGPGPVEGESYLYIGDIGDNDERIDLKYIYRIPEPLVSFNGSPVDSILNGVEIITFRYPDGNRDAETVMIDPLTRDIYVVSKRESKVRVYRAAYPQSTSSTITLEHVATLNFSLAVGGDISSSGSEILLKTYTNIYYWCRSPGQDLWQTFAEPPIVVPYLPEPQGEAVCWQADGTGYYTLSEELADIPGRLYFYPRLEPTAVGETRSPSPVLQLEQNYPNPFNPSTVIHYSLSQPAYVKLNIYDLRGRRVDTLTDHFTFPGRYTLEYRPSGLESGMYFYRLQVGTSLGTFSQSRKLILIK